MYVIVMKTAQEIRPPTLDLHALYTLCLVAPVARQPTHSIIKPRAAMLAPIVAKVNCTASNHPSRKWNTWSIIKEPNVTPLYIVPQNIPTPKQHIMVAISVAYGTLAMHSLHRLPMFPARYCSRLGPFLTGAACASEIMTLELSELM